MVLVPASDFSSFYCILTLYKPDTSLRCTVGVHPDGVRLTELTVSFTELPEMEIAVNVLKLELKKMLKKFCFTILTPLNSAFKVIPLK